MSRRMVAAVLLALVPACSSLPSLRTSAPLRLVAPTGQLTGLVVGLEGRPIGEAQLRAGSATTTSRADGTFAMSAPAEPSWLVVTATGHLPRTLAVEPGHPVLVRMTDQDGATVALTFGGDVMAGRRFYDGNLDGRLDDALLLDRAGVADHLALLADVQPALQDADLTLASLASVLDEAPVLPVTTRPARFAAMKQSVYASAPALAPALKRAGVDVVDLSSDHLADEGAAGLARTLQALDDANLPHVGAGANLDAAWRPARLTARGTRVSYVSCTTVTGEVTEGASTATASRAGPAACDVARLTHVVSTEVAGGATVCVVLHRGPEHPRRVRVVPDYTEVARRAGATVVVNNRPTITRSVHESGVAVVADALGPLLVDDGEGPSNLLDVDVRGRTLVSARTVPLLLDDMRPSGVVGAAADLADRQAAGTGVVGPAGDEPLSTLPTRVGRATAPLVPGEVARLAPGWQVAGRRSGVSVGQDLLGTGGFEDDTVGGRTGASRWLLNTAAVTPDAVHSGRLGARLPATQGPTGTTLVTQHRVDLPSLSRPLTLALWVRGTPGSDVVAELHWYDAGSGRSTSVSAKSVAVTAAWRQVTLDVAPPADARAVGVVVRMRSGTGAVAVDDVVLVQWAPRGSVPSAAYGVVRSKRAVSALCSVRLPAGGAALPGWVSPSPLLPAG